MERLVLAATANEIGRQSRYDGAPLLSVHSARETLLAWLQWNDPNGCYTDDLAANEDFDPMTLDETWDCLAKIMEDA